MVNARRVEGSKKVLAKGNSTMPKDRALQVSAGVYIPTIYIDTVQARKQFDLDFPPAERAHSFMVSCKGQVLYWNKLTNDFGAELDLSEVDASLLQYELGLPSSSLSLSELTD